MVVFRCICTICAIFIATPAPAEDWRERLSETPQLRRAIAPEAPQAASSLSGALRLGATSNVDEGFRARAGATGRTRHTLDLRRPAAGGVVGLRASATLDGAPQADDLKRGDGEVAASFARRAGRLETGMEARYLFESERGLRKHDIGAALDLRLDAEPVAPFATVTANALSHDPLTIAGAVYDARESDRLRLGVEAGGEVALGGRTVAALSAGYLGHDYRLRRDTAGFQRSNRSVFARLRVAHVGERLAAEAGAIVMRRSFDDPRHDPLHAVLADATLRWRIDDGTVLSANYVGDLEEPVFAGVGTIRTDKAALSLARALGEDVTLTGAVHMEENRYRGTDRIDRSRGAALEVAHALTASTALDVSLGYERLTTTLVDATADVWTLTAGLRYALSR